MASHCLFEPCFARPGEGHDKGGVEARGQAIRLQHLTPIPRGESLDELSSWLLSEVERHAPTRVRERFGEEQRWLRPPPETAFDARRLTSVSVGRSAMARVEGACAFDALMRWVLGAQSLGRPASDGSDRGE